MARVLVAGAGDVGVTVAQSLLARGDEVYALRRTAAPLPSGVVPVLADLTKPETLRRLPRGLGALVYCAAADRRDELTYRALYVDGLRNVLEAAGPVPRVAFTSTTGVYAPRDGAWVDETSPTEPRRFTGVVMLDAEAVVRSLGAGATSLRLGGIYGPGRTRLLDQVRRGDATCPDGPPAYSNRVHRDDAASAILHVLDTPDPPPVVNAVDDEPADRCEVLRWLAARLDVAAPRVVAAETLDRDDSKRVSNALLRSLGWRPRYPSYRDGYEAMISALA